MLSKTGCSSKNDTKDKMNTDEGGSQEAGSKTEGAAGIFCQELVVFYM